MKNIYHLAVALLANVWYGFPSRKLTVIGVTGTDGKTTTVHLIYHILKTANKRVSMISSVGAVIGGKKQDLGFHVTTPSPFALQRFIQQASESSEYLVLEVTSHALDQYRVWGVDFTVGVLTNITHEHLDYHKNYENYVRTKTKLLQIAKEAVVNADDESYQLIKSKFKIQNSKIQVKNKKFLTYGMSSNTDINPTVFLFKTKLVGEFNRYNCLAAIAVCQKLGIRSNVIRDAIASFTLPIGRMEIIHDGAFTVMIDFAHTPNALEKILSTVEPEVRGRLIHVFGSAGERDYQKRPEMGRVSARYVDVIVLTAEDPRSESVEKIMQEIESGIRNQESETLRKRKSLIHNSRFIIHKVPDRQEAITSAIHMARKGDLVLLTGKGHEQSMNYGHGEEPWSEHEAVALGLKLKVKS